MAWSFFFFNDTATTEIYTLSLHDALPICLPAPAAGALGVAREHGPFQQPHGLRPLARARPAGRRRRRSRSGDRGRSEEHTSELQSRQYLVCRLLLEKKKTPSV